MWEQWVRRCLQGPWRWRGDQGKFIIINTSSCLSSHITKSLSGISSLSQVWSMLSTPLLLHMPGHHHLCLAYCEGPLNILFASTPFSLQPVLHNEARRILLFFFSRGILLQDKFESLIKNCWDFPGGPVAKTPSSQCKGPRFDPWSGTRSHMLQLNSLHATSKDSTCHNLKKYSTCCNWGFIIKVRMKIPRAAAKTQWT